MKYYGLYEKGEQTGISPTGRPMHGLLKVECIEVAVSQKEQFVDSKELKYKRTTLNGLTRSQLPQAEQILVEGNNTPNTLEKAVGLKILSVNPYARLIQLSLEKCEI